MARRNGHGHYEEKSTYRLEMYRNGGIVSLKTLLDFGLGFFAINPFCVVIMFLNADLLRYVVIA